MPLLRGDIMTEKEGGGEMDRRERERKLGEIGQAGGVVVGRWRG